jgi:hypothetical protein
MKIPYPNEIPIVAGVMSWVASAAAFKMGCLGIGIWGKNDLLFGLCPSHCKRKDIFELIRQDLYHLTILTS